MERQHRQQVLIVDDEEINRTVLKEIFRMDYDLSLIHISEPTRPY